MKNRGLAPVIVVVVLAALGVSIWTVKPSWLPGASKRAAASTQTTAAVIATTKAQESAAAASVVKIGEANALQPESPAKTFIAQEVPVALSRLPAPDPQALLEAERRRSAVMEGRADEARRLYEQAAKESSRLQLERDAALQAKQEADLALEQAAAAEHAKTLQLVGMGIAVALALGLWLYAKNALGGVQMAAGKFMRDLRVKHPELAEKAELIFDSHLNRNEQAAISEHAK